MLRWVVWGSLGAAIAAFFFWPIAGWLLLVAHVALAVTGVFYMPSGIFGKVITKSRAGRPEVALTYDDGPDPETTPALLDLLRERGAKATFFVVGENVRSFPDLVRRCHEEGHTIANHSDGHSNFTNFYLYKRMRAQMGACQRAVEEAIGTAPRHYRPPVGLMNHAVGRAARDLGLEVVGWSIRSFDTLEADPDQVAQRVLDGLAPGRIALLHDGGLDMDRVLQITRRVLDGLEERGWEAVTLERLLAAT